MGAFCSICTDPSGESAKPTLLSDHRTRQQQPSEDILIEGGPLSSGGGLTPPESALSSQQKQAEQELRQEQARLEAIVATAGQDMLAVRRPPTFYHDQGFAALFQEHLKDTMLEEEFVSKLEPAPDRGPEILARPVPSFDRNIEQEMDAFVIEQLQSQTKEQLFANCPPIVENLL